MTWTKGRTKGCLGGSERTVCPGEREKREGERNGGREQRGSGESCAVCVRVWCARTCACGVHTLCAPGAVTPLIL